MESLSSLMQDNPQLKSAQQLFGSTGAGESNTSVGIPQISTRLRQLQAQRLIPQTSRATGNRAARNLPRTGGGSKKTFLTAFKKALDTLKGALPKPGIKGRMQGTPGVGNDKLKGLISAAERETGVKASPEDIQAASLLLSQ